METLYLQPNEIKITVTPDETTLTAQPSQVAVTASPNTLNVTAEPQTVELTARPNEVLLNVLSGANVTNNYTSGGKLTVEFDYTDFGATKTIGEIISGKVIINTVVEIDTAFDSGTFTIGKDSAQAILMTIADRGNAVNRYLVNNYIELTTTDTYKLFFSGSPTQGSGKVFITYV